ADRTIAPMREILRAAVADLIRVVAGCPKPHNIAQPGDQRIGVGRGDGVEKRAILRRGDLVLADVKGIVDLAADAINAMAPGKKDYGNGLTRVFSRVARISDMYCFDCDLGMRTRSACQHRQTHQKLSHCSPSSMR